MSDPETREYHITLLRHGESVGNAEGYHQGQAEFALTPKGQAQVKALADYWASFPMVFDLIISSPQTRAQQTALMIADALKTAVEFDSMWMERDNGIYAGMPHEEAVRKYPYPEFIPIYEHIGQTGESEWELFLRGGQAIQNILFRKPGNYLVVSHGGILNMTLRAILGIIPQANFQGPRFRFRNTSYASLNYRPDQHVWSIEAINLLPHWNEE